MAEYQAEVSMANTSNGRTRQVVENPQPVEGGGFILVSSVLTEDNYLVLSRAISVQRNSRCIHLCVFRQESLVGTRGKGSDLTSLFSIELTKIMAEDSSSHLQHNTPFEDVRINFAHLEDIEESTSNLYGFNDIDCGSWIVDSGATRDVCADLKYFANYFKASKPLKVSLPDSSKQVIAHIGTVKLPNYITLENVLHIPTFSVNLLSVSQLWHALPVSFHFLKSGCILQDQWNKVKLAVGRLVRHLYILDHEYLTMNPSLFLLLLIVLNQLL
ncbi:UNVERIFIED_CONTAM: hypothetical protein Sradi_1896200 [Sesamum radiatum]|uniref:Retrovirus-related Pol polyprotein from transposon TNT 1-94-like beta-barrel domain-containing protein n=1 Tax=Sesamum radiatum TaxID=300843 RepID=A0AAW2TXS2_SESRA